ncbi:MAG: cobalamin biosynthesis protein, partial [Synechococcus sp.]
MKRLGLCASQAGLKLLEPLLQAGELDAIAVPAGLLNAQRPELIRHTDGPKGLLQEHWGELELLVGALAAGALVRLVAPLLQHKLHDPAVLLLAAEGPTLLPLLGGHSQQADTLAEQLGPLLQANVIQSGFSSSQGLPALDSLGEAWGWRRGSGNWDELMHRAARHEPLSLESAAGQPALSDWLLASDLPLTRTTSSTADLCISSSTGAGCRWHPPVLWLGVGCERGSSLDLLRQAVDGALQTAELAAEAVAGLASIDVKNDEPALLALASERNWPLKFFRADELKAQAVPNPSAVVAAEVGCPSVAEAAALCAAGSGAELRAHKQISRGQPGEGAVTTAIAAAQQPWAPQRGHLHLIGAGPGALNQLTPAAQQALASSSAWVGYGLYLDLLEPLRRPDQVRFDGQLTKEKE